VNPDTVLDRIIQANPKPASAETPGNILTRSALLEELDRRSGNMQTQDKPIIVKPEPPRLPRRSRLGPALVGAFAVIIAIVVAVAVLSGDNEPNEQDVVNQPPGQTTVPVEEVIGPNLLEVAASTGQYDTFLELAQISGFDETLNAGTFTVFAPTDDAFAALPTDLLESLKTSPNPTILEDILGNLTMAVQLDSSQLTTVANGNGFLANVAGSTIFVAVDDDGTLTLQPTGFTGNTTGFVAKIIQPDLMASNGILHGIDGVLFPSDLRTFMNPTS